MKRKTPTIIRPNHHYYGMVIGARVNPATRLGSIDSGLITRARTRNGEIKVVFYHDKKTKRDYYEVWLELYHAKTLKCMRIADGIIEAPKDE